MPRSITLVACALSASVASWTYVAAAQTDGAPLPAPSEPPAAPTPGEPAPPAEPPAALPDAPPAVPPAEPPAAPPPAPTPPAAAPPSAAFPLPPETPPSAKKPPRRAEPPPSAATEPTPPSQWAPPSESAGTQKPSDGLFQAKPADGAAPRASDDKDGGTDQFKIGPVAGVGIPSVISFGGTLKLTRFLGGGVNIGLIPKVQLSYYGDATLSYQHYDIYGRIYPFGGGFFLSGGAGYATVEGTLSSQKAGTYGGFNGTVDYNSKGSVRTLMLTTLVGYFYTTSIGFSFGVDAGAQIPIAPSHVTYGSEYQITTNAPPQLAELAKAQLKAQADPVKQQTDQSVTDTLEKIGRTTLPTLNLRIGWIL